MPLKESLTAGECAPSRTRRSWRHELRMQLGLVVPVLLSQIALISLGMADTVMTGHAGSLDMPAVALGVSLWQPILLFGQGVIMAVTPAVAQLLGQGRPEEAGQILRQGLWLAILVSLPVMGLVFFLSYHLSFLGLEGELAGITGNYLRALLPGAPAWLLFVAFRSAMEGFSRVRPAMVASLAAVAVNIPGNWVFIFGKLGFPAMGGVGAGLASSITCWVMLAVIVCFAFHMPDFLRFLSVEERPKWKKMGRIARVGFPGALALLCEVSFFSLVAILLVPFGPVVVAGHQVALNFGSLVFIVPLSVGFAATIRIGVTTGEGRIESVRLAARTSLGIGAAFAIFTALITAVFRRQIAALYNPDPKIIFLADQLLILDAAYQILDALQTVGVAILRGYNDTKMIFAFTLVCYWFVGMPLGWLLGRTDFIMPKLGAAGFWVAFIVGVSFAAAVYLARIHVLEKHFTVHDL